MVADNLVIGLAAYRDEGRLGGIEIIVNDLGESELLIPSNEAGQRNKYYSENAELWMQVLPSAGLLETNVEEALTLDISEH